MANVLTPKLVTPINVPIEISTDSSTSPLQLYIGGFSVEDEYFYGKIYKKPGGTNIGIDISKHISEILNYTWTPDTTGFSYSKNSEFIKAYRVKMKTSTPTTVYDFSGYAMYQTPKIEDWYRLVQGLPYGRYREYLDNQTPVQVFNNGTMFIGQTGSPNWIPDQDNDVTTSTLPLAQNYYSILGSGVEPLYGKFYAHHLLTAGKYTIKYDVRIIRYAASSVVFKVAGTKIGGISPVDTGFISYQKEIYAEDLSPSVPFIETIFDGAGGEVQLRNIIIEETPINWALEGDYNDWMLHNRLYTYDTGSNRTWNKVANGSPIAIYICNPTGTALDVEVKRLYSNGRPDIGGFSIIEILGLTSLEAYSAYKIELYNPVYSNTAISIELEDLPVRTIYFEYDTCARYQLYYVNRLGGIEPLVMSGTYYETSEVEKLTYKAPLRVYNGTSAFNGKLSKQTNVVYNVDSNYTIRLNSAIENEVDYKYLEELISSPKVWLYDSKYNDMYAVDIVDTNYQYKKFDIDRVFNFEVEVKKQITNSRR